MKREAYLATLSFITVLLLGELDNAGSVFGITKPLWIGAASWLLWLLSHYTILGALILSVVTSFAALVTGTPSRVVPPTVLAGIGALAYLLNSALEDVMRWFNFERVTVLVNGVEVAIGYGTIPDEYQVVYYLCSAIPLGVFLVTITLYSYYVTRLHRADKTALEARGIRFEGAEEKWLDVDAMAPGGGGGGVAQSLVVSLRGERHGAALPGLYAPLRS